MEAVRDVSSEAVRQAKAVMAGIANRSARAQEDAHLRVMVYQMAAYEYVPVSTPVDVIECIREEFGSEKALCVKGFVVPDVQLDWSLLRYALENALSNARKYGAEDTIELAIEYQDPVLVLQVTNSVGDPQRQAALISKHGHDATRLLHHRGDAGGRHSTNLGGQAMRDVARLLKGSVSLLLAPTTSRLRLEVTAPRVVELEPRQPLLVHFIDDEPMMRMVYKSWVRQPSPLHADSAVFPPPDLSPAEADESMRSFATQVLTAQPRPSAVVLDQNLRSQVRRRENAITGTEIARTLRNGGYKGMIIIRSANISSKVIQEYLAAGADATMHKDEPRERLVELLVAEAGAHATSQSGSMQRTLPLLAGEGEGFWGAMSDADERGAILAEFREGARRTLDDLLALLDAKDVGALPDELHYLLGQCRTVGAQRMQGAVGECKSSFHYNKLVRLEELLAETFEAMDARTEEPLESTAAQYLRAKELAERVRTLAEEEPQYKHRLDEDSFKGSASGSAVDSSFKGSLAPALGLPTERGSKNRLGSQEEVVLPLVDWAKAQALGDLLRVACGECGKLLDELRQSLISCSEHCQLLLHSLCGTYELIGATRIARLVVDCEAHVTNFGPLQLEALNALHTETLNALTKTGTPLCSPVLLPSGATVPSPALLPTASPLDDVSALAPALPTSVSVSLASATRHTAAANEAAFANGLSFKSTHSNSSTTHSASGHGKLLFVAGIDDSSFARQVATSVLFPLLGADMHLSKALGETASEQQGFLEFALGQVDAAMQPLPPPHRQADVVLLDQNITLHDEPHLLGSQLATDLRERGYLGVICIISGVDEERRAVLESQPCVDMVQPKSFSPTTLATQVLQWHELKLAARLDELKLAARTSDPERDPVLRATSSLVDIEHFEGVPVAAIAELMAMAYDQTTACTTGRAGGRPHYTGPSSLYTLLAQLEDRCENGDDLRLISHTLKGSARCAGAMQLATEVLAYEGGGVRPSAENIAALWVLLEASRQELQASGLLGSSSE